MDLSEKIRWLRNQKGFSQERFAEELGVTRQTVYKWESGLAKPEYEKLRAISLLFQVSMDDLFDEEASLSEKKVEVQVDRPLPTAQVLTRERITFDTPSEHMKWLLGKDIYRMVRRRLRLAGILGFLGIGPTVFFFIFLLAGVIEGTLISFVATMLTVGVWLLCKQKAKAMLTHASEQFEYKRHAIMTEWKEKGYQLIEIQPFLCSFFYIHTQDREFGIIHRDQIAYRCPFDAMLRYELVGTPFHMNARVGLLRRRSGFGATQASTNSTAGLLQQPSIPMNYTLTLLSRDLSQDKYTISFPFYFSHNTEKMEQSIIENHIHNQHALAAITKYLDQIKG